MTMEPILIMILAGLSLILVTGLVYCLIEISKLKKAFPTINDKVRRNHEDIAGLCAAALEVDQQLALNVVRLNEIIDVLNALPQPTAYENAPIPDYVSNPSPTSQVSSLLNQSQTQVTDEYDAVIQKIRSGIEIEQLVKECNLSRDEAVLLCRLHGGLRG